MIATAAEEPDHNAIFVNDAPLGFFEKLKASIAFQNDLKHWLHWFECDHIEDAVLASRELPKQSTGREMALLVRAEYPHWFGGAQT